MTSKRGETREWSAAAVPQLRPDRPFGKGLQKGWSKRGAESPSADRATGDGEMLQLQPAGTYRIQMPFQGGALHRTGAPKASFSNSGEAGGDPANCD